MNQWFTALCSRVAPEGGAAFYAAVLAALCFVVGLLGDLQVEQEQGSLGQRQQLHTLFEACNRVQNVTRLGFC
jgi:hypothetical protein